MNTEWNSESVTRIRLHRRVTAAVLAVDDFTGRPILDAGLIVRAAQVLQKPVRRQDGYFVFLDCPVPVLDITVKAWSYHPASIRVEPASLPRLFPVVKLRLTPNRNYRIPPETTCLEGKTAPGTMLRVICQNDPRPLRLLYDYGERGEYEGRLIQIYDPFHSDLEGRQFALLRKEESNPEFFQVQQLAEEQEGGCILSAPLSGDCRKAGTTILPAFTVTADEQGEFFLPLQTPAVKLCDCRIFWKKPESGWMEQQLSLQPGRVTRIGLTENR